MVPAPLLSRPRARANFLITLILPLTTKTNALVLYDDGSLHYVTESISDAINLRSSSSLVFSEDSRFVVRAPKGSESAVRLYMSSLLNMTAGEIIGGDLDENGDESDDNFLGAGVIAGSASRAEFHDGATVRGGNHVGETLPVDEIIDSVQTFTNFQSGKGGDALVALYFGSTITIKGGNFIAGRGSSLDGHSLHVAYDAQAQVYGGSFQGSFLARDRGAIIAYGCLSRVGNRLVGHLENGDEVDVQLVEENGGQVIIESSKFVEECGKYHRRSSGERLGFGNSAVLNMMWIFGGLYLGYF